MDSSLLSDIDVQITCLQEVLSLSSGLREKIVRLEKEKKEALEKCDSLLSQIESMKNTKCSNCSLLSCQLIKEREEKAVLKEKQKAKLLEAIAKTLEGIDDVNTNHMTNAHQLLTQVCEGLDDSTESRKDQKTIQLLNDSEASEDESIDNILVNETIMEINSEEMSNDCSAKPGVLLEVPETEPTTGASLESRTNQLYKLNKHMCSRSKNGGNLKENRVHSGERAEIQHQAKRLKSSPQTPRTNAHQKEKSKTKSPCHPIQVDTNETVFRIPDRSPSVLSELIELPARNERSCGTSSAQEEKETCWKMKPSTSLESNNSNVTGKKLKQMTLSLSRPEKKHDISLSNAFKGGVANISTTHKDDESDVVLPSPERLARRGFTRKQEPYETMEDPDLTVFQPAVTSTCLPANNSFDRLPETAKSPPYKYRRDPVRKREERLKLPGQDCDQCAKYYEAAGGKPDDVRSRINGCSRHRDKYQIRANTPPGFWDPVFPSTPEDDATSKS